jgi:hypothetical protein
LSAIVTPGGADQDEATLVNLPALLPSSWGARPKMWGVVIASIKTVVVMIVVFSRQPQGVMVGIFRVSVLAITISEIKMMLRIDEEWETDALACVLILQLETSIGLHVMLFDALSLLVRARLHLEVVI